ncbi:FAD-dependent monooxygenase [Paramicrobacterium agarici]|uniref:2-polyprenyl-6-methoxyphenol hydroxylase-like FAD-dependent oxidoreductase n=1 Tax=Paramicrobacterium agarici TaxID=630514 RepID=A0A2A9DS07_9MICO|nr:FAD-dependent monooxygenase [Microbacterium agarici]PFG29363.1 2-polyprenyl-6-methoxyphenol hydroxylase-like FAD-dependent oxidoreductase [Microbacterium agarici]
MDTDVVVIGAGPTGLMLAAWLAELDIDAVIVDGKAEPTRESRAIGLQARSIEIYDQLGVVERVMQEARVAPAARPGYGHQMFNAVEFDALGEGQTPYPQLYILEQSRNERILVDALRSRGRDVRWGQKLVGLADAADRDGVTVTVADGYGAEQTITARYVVGADGASSLVREIRGIAFEGTTNAETFCVIDANGVTGLDEDAINIRPFETDLLLTFPMEGEGHARIITVVPEAERHDDPDALENAVRERVRISFGVTWQSHTWFATYRVHHRVAERFRDGAVFLAGDAAHVHSPVGAQGMNTGLQDAHNLAFAFADVLKRGARDSILDRYEAERMPVARHLIETTDSLFSFVTSPETVPRLVRRIGPRLLGPIITRLLPRTWVGDRGFGYLGQLRVRYHVPGSEHADGTRDDVVGRRLPWAGDNVDALRSHEWQVHEYGSADPADTARLERALGCEVHVFSAAPDTPLIPGEFYLVRPDGYVVARARPSEAAETFAGVLPGRRTLEGQE